MALNPLKWPWEVYAALGGLVASVAYLEYKRAKMAASLESSQGATKVSVKAEDTTSTVPKAVKKTPSRVAEAEGTVVDDTDVATAGAAASPLSLNLADLSPPQQMLMQQFLMVSQAGDMNRKQGNYAQAIKCFVAAREILGQCLGARHLINDRPLQSLFEIHRDLGKHKEALGFLKESLALRVAAVGDKHELCAEVYMQIGQTLMALEAWEQADTYLRRAREVFDAKKAMLVESGDATDKDLSALNVTVASVDFVLARAHTQLKHYETALAMALHARDVFRSQEALAKDSVLVVHATHAVANILRLMDRHDEAQLELKQLLADMDGTDYKPNNPARMHVLNTVVAILFDVDAVEEAQQLADGIRAASDVLPPITRSRFLGTRKAMMHYTNLGDDAEAARAAKLTLTYKADKDAFERWGPLPEAEDAVIATLTVTLEAPVTTSDGSFLHTVTVPITPASFAGESVIEVDVPAFDACNVGHYWSVATITKAGDDETIVGRHHQLYYVPYELETVTEAEAARCDRIADFLINAAVTAATPEAVQAIVDPEAAAAAAQDAAAAAAHPADVGGAVNEVNEMMAWHEGQ